MVGGKFLPVRCKRRDCPYCGRLAAFELAQALLIDARVSPPTHALTLTTSKPWQELDPADYRKGAASVVQRLRRRFGSAEYFARVEFTTGKSRTSGGHRRMHAHHLVKGLAGVDVIEAERIVRETWERSTGAYVVEVAELVTPGAAIAYLGLHHHKSEQLPPKGWRGMASRSSRGYWHRPVSEIRELARAEQRRRRIRWRQQDWIDQGLPEDVAGEWAELKMLEPPAGARLVKVRESNPVVPL